MGDQEHKHNHTLCKVVKWGSTALAGAAVAGGVVLMGAAAGFEPSMITGLLATKTAEATGQEATQTFMQKATEFAATNTGKALIGASLAGGGLAHIMSDDGAERDHHDRHLARDNRETFAMQEDMRKAQIKMMIQAAAAGNPQAQAMLANQQGLG